MNKYIKLLLILVGLDQLVKYFVYNSVLFDKITPLAGNFNFYPLLNMMNMGGGEFFYQTGNFDLDLTIFKIFYLIVGVGILVTFRVLFEKLDELGGDLKEIQITKLGLVSLGGGVLGNMIDRIHLKGVVDYISYDNGVSGIIFNLADVFIWGGALMLVSCSIIHIIKAGIAKLQKNLETKTQN